MLCETPGFPLRPDTNRQTRRMLAHMLHLNPLAGYSVLPGNGFKILAEFVIRCWGVWVPAADRCSAGAVHCHETAAVHASSGCASRCWHAVRAQCQTDAAGPPPLDGAPEDGSHAGGCIGVRAAPRPGPWHSARRGATSTTPGPCGTGGGNRTSMSSLASCWFESSREKTGMNSSSSTPEGSSRKNFQFVLHSVHAYTSPDCGGLNKCRLWTQAVVAGIKLPR